MDWILIGLGAGAGSMLRYEIGRRMSTNNGKHKIFATFAVNCFGAFLLGAVVALSLNGQWWHLVADGLLGGFTTFSTFMVEGVVLIRGNQKANALSYIAATLALGIIAFLLGESVVGLIYAR